MQLKSHRHQRGRIRAVGADACRCNKLHSQLDSLHSFVTLLFAFGCVSAVASAIHKQLLISKHEAAAAGVKKRGSLLRFSCNVNVWSFIQSGDVILISAELLLYGQLVP